MELGNKIKRLRLHCNLTQEELADRCELTKGYISQLENELTSPSIATLVDILSALGTNLKEFFSDEVEEKIIFKEEDFIEKDSGALKINWLVNNAQVYRGRRPARGRGIRLRVARQHNRTFRQQKIQVQ